MEPNDLNMSEDTEFLSLRERILLTDKQGKKYIKSTSRSSILKRVHSISDSDESDHEMKNLDEEFHLPPLNDLLSNPKVPEALILSDSEDEFQTQSEFLAICQENVQKLDDLSSDHKVTEVLILSDSEDEVHAQNEVLEKYKDHVQMDQICLTEKSEDHLDSLPNKKMKCKSSRSENSPTKKKKDSDKELAKRQRLELREEKKREKELAKAIRLTEKELQKSKKPDECLKAMRVVIDHNLILLNDSQDIFCSLDEANVKYSIEENPINCSVAWCKTIADITVENTQVVKEEREVFENEMVVLIPNDSFIKMIHASVQKSKGKDTHEVILLDYIINVTSMFPQMKITYVVLNIEKHIRSLKETESNDVLKKMAKQVSKSVIDEVTVEVQVQLSVNFIFLNTMKELGDLIFRFTKAIAEAPQKREKQLQKDLAFSWYADADTGCPVKLGKDNSSYMKLWQQQLQQFQNVSQETAEAIATMYSSPANLLKAYRQCSTTKQAETLLQDIVVRRNYGPLGTQRRIGPELSYKIHLFFTSQDGNQIIQR